MAVNFEIRQIVALEVTGKYLHDGRRIDVKSVIGDRAYDLTEF